MGTCQILGWETCGVCQRSGAINTRIYLLHKIRYRRLLSRLHRVLSLRLKPQCFWGPCILQRILLPTHSMMQTNQWEMRLACCEEACSSRMPTHLEQQAALFLTLGNLNANSTYEVWKMGSPALLMEAGVDLPSVYTILSRQKLNVLECWRFQRRGIQGIFGDSETMKGDSRSKIGKSANGNTTQPAVRTTVAELPPIS